jgi:hypothetical protein
LVIKTLDLDWIRIRIGIKPKMLDPDPYQYHMSTDPQPWKKEEKHALKIRKNHIYDLYVKNMRKIGK